MSGRGPIKTWTLDELKAYRRELQDRLERALAVDERKINKRARCDLFYTKRDTPGYIAHVDELIAEKTPKEVG